MFKSFHLLLLTTCLCAHLSGAEIINNSIYYTEYNMVVAGDNNTSSLDFSEVPQLENIWIHFSSYNGLNHLKDGLGLGKNHYLKNLSTIQGAYSQLPVSFSYLPSVEYYSIVDAHHDLDYLSTALPSL